MKTLVAALAMVLGTAGGLAAQEAQTVQLPPDKPYKHKANGLVVPTTLGGIARTGVSAWSHDQLDDGINFEGPGAKEAITVYVFRAVTGSVPVWFDRVRWQIEHRGVYGTAAALDRPAAFTPPGQSTASGLMMAFAPSKPPYVGTAEAMMPLGPDWYVAVRYSSATLAPEALLPRLQAVIGELGWPRTIPASPAAALIQPCNGPLKLSGDPKAVADPLRNALFASILSSPDLRKRARRTTTPPATWCLDLAGVTDRPESGVYRANESTDAYLLTIGDAGRGLIVGPAFANVLVANEAPTWDVQLVDVDQTTTFVAQDRLPTPDRALAIAAGPRVSSSSTWGKSRAITINTDAVKK